MISFDDMFFRISCQGQDGRLLGRLSYFSITGKNGLKITIITCYCPCKGSYPGSVYSQRLLYISENESALPENIICPQQLFGYDLRTLLKSLTEQGHQLIVCADFNSEYSDLSSWMLDIALTDILLSRHGPDPKTYNRSQNKPID